jgi:hypothetical protein
MFHTFTLLALCTSLLPISWAAPVDLVAREPQNVFPQGASVAVVLDLPTATPLTPPGSTGSLYGSTNLQGYDGNPVKGSAVVENYKLAPGQLENPNEGLALDFSQIDKPQPIRGKTGNNGATDPGPGELSYQLC